MKKYLIIGAYLIVIHSLLWIFANKFYEQKSELKLCLKKGIENAEYIQKLNYEGERTLEKIQSLREIVGSHTCPDSKECNCYNSPIDPRILDKLYK